MTERKTRGGREERCIVGRDTRVDPGDQVLWREALWSESPQEGCLFLGIRHADSLLARAAEMTINLWNPQADRATKAPWA